MEDLDNGKLGCSHTKTPAVRSGLFDWELGPSSVMTWIAKTWILTLVASIQSPARTMDPAEADFFFVPIYGKYQPHQQGLFNNTTLGARLSDFHNHLSISSVLKRGCLALCSSLMVTE
jgi:hypothetical protein